MTYFFNIGDDKSDVDRGDPDLSSDILIFLQCLGRSEQDLLIQLDNYLEVTSYSHTHAPYYLDIRLVE